MQHVYDRYGPLRYVIHERRFERGVREFVDAECSQQRVLANAVDQVNSAYKETALRAAPQLVSACSDQVDTKSEALWKSRLRNDSQAFERGDKACALVVEYWDIFALSQGNQILQRGPFCEALDTEVGLVHTEDQASISRDRVFIIDQAGPVRSANLAHP